MPKIHGFEPFWGPITSNVDWCEANYTHTRFVAEFWNTISNLPMIVLGLFGIYYTYVIISRHPTSKSKLIATSGTQENIGRFTVGFFFLFLVGVGSTLFHATLLYHYQLMDELPMILGSLVFVYISLDLRSSRLHKTNGGNLKTSNNPGNASPNVFRRIWNLLVSNLMIRGLVLLAYGVVTSILMAIDTTNPIPMNVSYVFLVSFVILRCASIYLRATANTYAHNTLRRIFQVSLVFYLGGSISWLIEKHFCKNIFFIAQYLHMVWHVLAGSGTYLFILWTLFAHMEFLDLEPRLLFKWGIIPYIEAKKSSE